MKWIICLCVVACGSTKGPPLDAIDRSLKSIAITPGTATLKRGFDAPVQLVATGTLADGTTRDVTDKVMWASSDATIATVDAGLVTATLRGMATITASAGNVSGMAQVTVTTPQLALTQITPEVDTFTDAYATGDVAPATAIKGAATTLGFPWGVKVIGSELFVVDESAAAIDVWPLDATGNVAPTRRITGAATTLAQPYALAERNNEIYVTSASAILVFSKDATGNVVPTRSITGALTTLTTISTSILIYKDEIYVATGLGSILVFPVMATGNVAPTRVIAGPHTMLSGSYELAISNDEIFASGTNNAIVVIGTTDSGDVAPRRAIIGSMTSLSAAVGLQIVGDEIFALNALAPQMLQVFTDAHAATGNVAAARSLAGMSTTLTSTRELAVF